MINGQNKTKILGSKLFVDPKLKKLVNELSKTVRATMKADIQVNGIDVPLSVDAKTGRIYDGMNRFEIGTELGIKVFDVNKRLFESEDAARSFVIRVNLKRRQQNEAQRVQSVLNLEPYEKKLAAARSKSGVALGPNEPGGRVRNTLAMEAQVSPTGFFKISTVLKSQDDELKKKLLSGEKKTR